ncbi:hypothetical protein, partial [Microbulbifer thermotolerans]|uniref:hypothetical protein n=1 Tax=Microbulbifer thermotolerans TaxID=252514 RepID=UPI00396A939C
LELAGGVVGKFQLFAVGQCGGDAVAGGVVVVGDFCQALPVGGDAAAGVVFPAQFAVGVLGFDELSEAVVAEAGGAVGGDFLQQAAEGVPFEEGVYAFAGVGVGAGVV